jgi:anti-sigma B factor antagonist
MEGLRAEVVDGPSGSGSRPSRVVNLLGEIDLVTAPSLDAALGIAFGERTVVTVNLAQVSFLDSVGISELVRARNRLRSVDGDLFVVNAQANVQTVLLLSGLEDLIADPDLKLSPRRRRWVPSRED